MSREQRNQRGSPAGASRYSDSGFSSSAGRPTNAVPYTELDSRYQFYSLSQLQIAYRQLWDEKVKLEASCYRYEDELDNKRAPTPEIDTLRKYRNKIQLLTEDNNNLIKEKKSLAKDLDARSKELKDCNKQLEVLRDDNFKLVNEVKQQDSRLMLLRERLTAVESDCVRYREERNAARTAVDGKVRSGTSSGSSSDRRKEKERAKEEKARLGQRFVCDDKKPVEQALPTRTRRMSFYDKDQPYIEDEVLARSDNYSTAASAGALKTPPVDMGYQAPRYSNMDSANHFATSTWTDAHQDSGTYHSNTSSIRPKRTK